ncbi:MAG: T9SS C-terminal target domain-containing protein [Calditrichaeota bacterium]|nr:MAG: T9SS C-terminal target domain-containing protein [Calditrichota bacterium]
MKNSIISCITILFLFTVSTKSQISIPTNNNQPVAGSQFETFSSSPLNETIFDMLTGGSGNMDFDFSSFSFSSSTIATVIESSSAPYIDSFPGANVVQYTTQGSNDTDTMWTFTRSESDVYENLGSFLRIANFGDIFNTLDLSTPDATFPLSYNDSWQTIKHYSQASFGFSSNTYDTTFNTVAAYGNALYNGNSFPCLRINFVQRLTTEIQITGFPTTITVDSLIGAIYIAADFNYLAVVQKAFVSGNPPEYYCTAAGEFVKIPTNVRETTQDNLPDDFNLSQNYPNPFNPTTSIEFQIPVKSNVLLEVYNINGQLIKQMVNENLSAGSYISEWDGTNRQGRTVATGMYFYRLTTDSYSTSKKMILLK